MASSSLSVGTDRRLTRNRLNHREQAAKKFADEDYDGAISHYTTVLDDLRLTHTPVDVGILEKLSLSLLKTKKFDDALTIAKGLIARAKGNAEGYVLAAKAQMGLKDNVAAVDVLALGLKNALQQEDIWKTMRDVIDNREQENSKTKDPEKRLPLELFQRVLKYLPFRQLVLVQSVSRAWRVVILNTPDLWTTLDFRFTKPFGVTVNLMRGYYSISKGHIKKFCLRTTTDTVSWSELALKHIVSRSHENRRKTKTKATWNIKNMSNTGESSLRYLSIESGERYTFDNWHAFGTTTLNVLSKLEVLRVSAYSLSPIIHILLNGNLPNLYILDCYHDIRHGEDYMFIQFMDIPAPSDAAYVPLNQIKVFNLGGSPRIKAGHPGGVSVRDVFDPETSTYLKVVIDPEGFHHLLRLFPNLERLSCVSVRITESDFYSDDEFSMEYETGGLVDPFEMYNPYDVYARSWFGRDYDGFDDRPGDFAGPIDSYNFRRVDLRHNPKLETVRFSHTNMNKTPILPPSCKTFELRQTPMTPRTLKHISGRTHYSDATTGDIDAVVLNEYENLEMLEVSFSESLSNDELLGALSRCDPNKLKCLSLRGSMFVRYDMGASLGYPCSEPGTFSSACNSQKSRPLASQLVDLCPELRFLDLAENDDVTDSVIEQLHGLRHLEVIDLSMTRVTIKGIAWLIGGKARADHGSYLTVTELCERIKANSDRLAAGTTPFFMTSIKTLVLNNCEAISEQECYWLRSCGFAVEHMAMIQEDWRERDWDAEDAEDNL
ncbi:hypothetical protein POJ06DRAFT_212427 [Lipomyces tetrasporus]|uniref:F-box domain-containing protein n=1 Tax=Lipomyces tetrasporus TaxID=54092 RepID=A0AAD7QQH9_9ASCO|nr:uncharacterized protein POJ06DRAFT_212427 [Lipomyces tetrasporus]KAJ8099453.1 hypothetical protein POJ06DRAFT_212427 [Lipomyces tetrasporus]